MFRKIVRVMLLALVVLFILIQFVPYGRQHTNPTTRVEPQWDSPETRALAKRACFDCHSNETVWPWYSFVAPASWLVYSDVEEGRRKLNFSEWDRPQKNAHEAAQEVEKGKMPLRYYVYPFHLQARLSEAEKAQLIRGLQATVGSSGIHRQDN